jgi:predicted small secreted protein
MRKILIIAGLLAGGMLLTGSPSAQAAVGCSCLKVGSPIGTQPVCVADIAACNTMGGVCVLPCDYRAPMKAVKHPAKKHAAKKPPAKHAAKKPPAKKHPAKKSTKKKKM